MKKTLTLIRHAKADWPESINDFNRPLLERGVSDAIIMGKYLYDANFHFDAVICSDATRARETLQNLQAGLPIKENNISYEQSLYMSSKSTVMNLIGSLPDTLNWVAIIGHNPTQTQLCNYLAEDNLTNLPTCGVYTIEFQVDSWNAIGKSTGKFISLLTPKSLKQH